MVGWQLTRDIHGEVNSQNKFLDSMVREAGGRSSGRVGGGREGVGMVVCVYE